MKKIAILIGCNLSKNFLKNKSTNIGAVLNTWRKLIGDTFDMEIISCHAPPDFLKKHYKVHQSSKWCNLPVPKLLKDFGMCFNYAKQCHPDLFLHISNPHRDGLVICLVGKLLSIPVLVRCTGDTYSRYKVYPPGIPKLKAMASMIFSHMAYSCASRTVCLGPIMRNRLLQKTSRPVDILPTPVNLGLFSPVQEEEKAVLKKAINVPPNKILVLFVGRLEKLKGSDRLLNIIQSVNKNRRDYFFGIIGEGPDAKKLKKIKTGVRMFGNVAHSDMPRFYQAADVLILPSRSEGMPNVILEALACGTPVLATSVGEISSVVSNICRTNKNFVDCLLKRDWRTDKLPENYDWQSIKQQYIRTINETIEKAKHGH